MRGQEQTRQIFQRAGKNKSTNKGNQDQQGKRTSGRTGRARRTKGTAEGNSGWQGGSKDRDVRKAAGTAEGNSGWHGGSKGGDVSKGAGTAVENNGGQDVEVATVGCDSAVVNGSLIGPDGRPLQRSLGKDDNDLRHCMVNSILQPEAWEALNELESGGSRWMATNLGKTFVSEHAVHNLFAAVPAQKLGLGTVMRVGGESYMVNANGDRFPLRRQGKQLRFDALLVDKVGFHKRVDFVHDSGASANILRGDESKVWADPGNGIVFMGGFVGGEHKLVGGNDLKVFLRVSSVLPPAESDAKLTMNSVLEQISLVEMGAVPIEDARASPAPTREKQYYPTLDGAWMDDFTNGSDANSSRRVLERVASAKSLVSAVHSDEDRLDVKHPGVQPQLGKHLGIIRRMKEMERASEIYPHLSTQGLNKMVSDGYLPNGIEYHAQAKIQDEATMIGRGIKAKVTKKRTPGKGSDTGVGYRAPFFVTFGDLVDLSAETTGNRWGYRYLLTLMCKEYGVAKVYPITGKDDVRRAWRQFKQWLKIITPFVVAALGVEPQVTIFASDRGSEFVTTNGRTRSAMDEELLRDGISRWSPSAGDSNKCGKIEAFNRILVGAMNVALRRGGAKNIYAFDAATHFENHFNMSPTSANLVGKGEPPFKTIGLPLHNDKLVRFFCPGWVTMPKNIDTETGRPSNHKHLNMRKQRCFIIGYGSNICEGGDTDGYKVVLGNGTVYSSLHVTPTPDMEVSTSFLTGLRHDPLKEGVLVRRIFDVTGDESLTFKIPQDSDGEDIFPKLRSTDHTDTCTRDEEYGQNPPGQQRKMTVGTGATGQMSFEMDDYAGGKAQSRNDVMTKDAAHDEIRSARQYDKRFVWKSAADANKGGASRKRYEHYSKHVKTFTDYDNARKDKHRMLHGDLVNDLIKGHVRFEGSETKILPPDDSALEMDEDHIHLTGYTAEDVTPGIDLNVADNICGADAVSQLNSLKSQFFEQIVPEAKENLEVDEDVPIWLALAAFHHAEVWVEGRKQPSTIKEAMRLPEWNEWREAIRKEILGLIEIGVWAEIPREAVPKGVKVLPGKMILEIKTEDGKFKKCKARYVSRGDLSSRGEHYWETSSHQVRSKSLRIYFATSAVDYARTKRKSFIPRNLDIRQAYIKRKRKVGEPEVYMELPEWTDDLGHNKSSGFVAKMLRHLYGEPDGGRAFERELLEFMDKIGAIATVSDRMVFQWSWKEEDLKILAHVDDLIYSGSTDAICDEFYRLVTEHFGECTGGTVATIILGIKIEWDLEKCTVKMSQRAHAEKFLEAFGFDVYATATKRTPLPLNVAASENTGRKVGVDEWDYFMWCGFANWLATNTRIDCVGAVNLCGRYAQNPGTEHVSMQKHILRYIAGTLDEGITFHGRSADLCEPYDVVNKLICSVDSDHGGCIDTKRSTTSVIVTLNGGPIIWRVLKQRVVTTSTPHSESIALASAIQEIIWARDFMAEIGHEQGTTRVLEDNQSTVLQSTGDYKSSKSDHYRRIQFYIEDNQRKGIIWIDKVPTTDNIADLGTKQVKPIEQFEKLRDRANGKTPYVYMGAKVKDILAGKYGTGST